LQPLKRSQPALRLSKTPLIFVLAQVRVAPITQIIDYLPKIQEVVRHQGFPGLVKREIEIEHATPDGKRIRETKTQWEFVNKTQNRSIAVDDSSLVLQVTDYDSGEHFFQDLRMALEAYAAHARPTDLLRVGLRYVDLIKPIADKNFADLINPSLRTMAVPLAGVPVAGKFEVLRATSPQTKLLIRYTEASEGLAFPPDIAPFISLKFRQSPIQKSPFGLLDTDHFDERATEFAADDILNRAENLHDILDGAFRTLVTPAAISAWT
jgi:uncharacterized protein (TIGR04255 family)